MGIEADFNEIKEERKQSGLSKITEAFALSLSLLLSTPSAFSENLKTIQFDYTAPDGKNIKLSDYKGKWVLVNFWSPSCSECDGEIESIQKLKDKGFVIISAIMNKDDFYIGIPPSTRIQNRSFANTMIDGGKKGNNLSLPNQVGPVDFFPTSYLYNPEGEIVMYIPKKVNGGNVLDYLRKKHGIIIN